jgi:hypothetical protein
VRDKLTAIPTLVAGQYPNQYAMFRQGRIALDSGGLFTVIALDTDLVGND